jgi:inosine-uridine nucleoside N-ribohydrolase
MAVALLAVVVTGPEAKAESAAPIPVLVDTDIGTDIDDAFALAFIMRSPELQLLGVTTVSGDSLLRARLAAKLLALGGPRWTGVPVYAGAPGFTQPLEQGDWARDFTSPAVHFSGAVEFLRAEINRRPGEITILALGELTNLAALLAAEPDIGRKIRRIVLMGGALRRGYAEGSPAQPEWNIRCNVAAARAVFAAGVPLTMAPLDATLPLRLDAAARAEIFSQGTPVAGALAELTAIWQRTNPWKLDTPVLFDVLPVALLFAPGLAPLEPMAVEIDDDGLTRAVPGRPANAAVAPASDVAAFREFFLRRMLEHE